MLFNLRMRSTNPAKQYSHSAITVTVAIALGCALCVTIGCNPKVEKTAPTRTDTVSPKAATAPDSANLVEPKAAPLAEKKTNPTVIAPNDNIDHDIVDGESNVISGDLSSVDWDSLVGQEVTVRGNLVVVDTFDLARRGRLVVARDRLYVPTSQVDPNDADPTATSFEGGSNVAKVVAAQKYNDRAMITLDDGSSAQNIFPPTLLPSLGTQDSTVRVGSIIHGITGKVTKSRNKLFLLPNEPLNWTPSPRPPRPSVGDADTIVASFNVLNFFSTIDDEDNDARGADSESELQRQEAKIVSAITELKADVIGLMELENNIDAEQRLVAALNKKFGNNVFKGCGVPESFQETPGGDNAIRVGIIYRADRISSVGDVTMVDDDTFWNARTPIVQSFKSKAGGKPFTVIVNHFKSKSGSRADEANKNKGDGQGAYNAARRAQAIAIANYIDALKGDGSPRVLVIGDLNAYQQEDPIDALRAKGLIDLHERFDKQASGNLAGHYSYVYRGQSGSLDHAFATEMFASDVTGIATWHINADEPQYLDYNEEYKSKTLFGENPYRSSDHDPVIIGIRK